MPWEKGFARFTESLGALRASASRVYSNAIGLRDFDFRLLIVGDAFEIGDRWTITSVASCQIN